MTQPPQHPSGDYGYDLAHEGAGGVARPESEDRPRHAIVHAGGTSDRGEDYGYDEAHSF